MGQWLESLGVGSVYVRRASPALGFARTSTQKAQMPPSRSRTYEYLLEGIAWSRTWEEFDRLERFARAHYTGRPLEDIVAAIDGRRSALNVPGPWVDDPEGFEALIGES